MYYGPLQGHAVASSALNTKGAPHPIFETDVSLTWLPHSSHSLQGPVFGVSVSLNTRQILFLQIRPFLLFEYCIPFIINNIPFKLTIPPLSEICQ